jgi:hypothetical protein
MSWRELVKTRINRHSSKVTVPVAGSTSVVTSCFWRTGAEEEKAFFKAAIINILHSYWLNEGFL